MKLKQLIGPFTAGPLDLGLSNVKYMQIGIEHPRIFPYARTVKIPADSPSEMFADPVVLLSINDIDFSLTEKEFLEFENLQLTSCNFVIKNSINNPYFIITIAYE